MQAIEPAAWERVAPLLRADEQLLWTGRPDPSKTFTQVDIYLVPFTLAWCAFVVFWEASATSEGAPAFFLLVGALFLLMGLYFVFGRFIVKRYQKQRTVYALTTQRAIVLTGASQVHDTPVVDQPVSVRRSRDGRHATVIIGGGTGRSAMMANTGWPSWGQYTFGFFDVPDPDPMLQALEKARQPRLPS